MDWVHTIILIIHVLGAALIIGVAFVSLVIELKLGVDEQFAKLLKIIWKAASAALGIQLLTGIYLAATDWEHVGSNPLFWVKMFLYFIVGTAIGIVNRKRLAKIKAGDLQAAKNHSGAWAGFLVFILVASIGVIMAESQA
jgi:hypothetical protein